MYARRRSHFKRVQISREAVRSLCLPSELITFFRCWWVSLTLPSLPSVRFVAKLQWLRVANFVFRTSPSCVERPHVTAPPDSEHDRCALLLLFYSAVFATLFFVPSEITRRSLLGGMPPKRSRAPPSVPTGGSGPKAPDLGAQLRGGPKAQCRPRPGPKAQCRPRPGPEAQCRPRPGPEAQCRPRPGAVASTRAPTSGGPKPPSPEERPPAAILDAVEDARRRFAESSGLARFRGSNYYKEEEADNILENLLAEMRSEVVNADDLSSRVRAWNEQMSGNLRISFCVACGVFLIGDEISEVSQRDIEPLALTDDERAAVKPLSTCWTPASCEQIFAIHAPSESMNGMFHVCKDCFGDLRCGKVPEYSVKAGFDYGQRPEGLPDLSLLELVLISPARAFGHTLKLKAPAADPTCSQLATTGHVIVFPHDAPERVSNALILSDPGRLNSSFSVKFIGTASQWDVINPRLGSTEFSDYFACRPKVMKEWLRVLRENNEMYRDIVVREEDLGDERCDLIQQKFFRDVSVVTDPVVIAAEVKTDSSGRHKVSRDPTNPKVYAEGIAVLPRMSSSDAENDQRDALLRGAAALLPELSVSAQLDAREAEPTTIKVKRSDIPFNDYTDNAQLLRAAFPHLFLLGKGVPNARGSKNVNIVPDALAEKYLFQKDNRFATDHTFIFQLFNQKMRHAVSLAVKLRTDQSPEKIQAFQDMMNDVTFQNDLRSAVLNPKDPASEAVFEKLVTYLRLAAPRVPYSAASGHRAVSEALALHDFFGLSSVFATVSPSDVDSPLAIRLALGGLEAKVELPNVSLSTRAVYENPVAASRIFERLVTSFLETVVNIGAGHVANRPKGRTSGDSFGKGVFGTSCAYFGVVEAQGRGSLHIHMLLWAGIPPQVLECLVEDKDLMTEVAQILNSHFCAELPAEVHQDYDDRKAAKTKADRVAQNRECPDPKIDPEGYQRRWHSVAATVQIHEHAPMCHEGNNGKTCCRVGMPQEAIPETGAVELDVKKFKEQKVVDVFPAVSPMQRPKPFASNDKRAVVVEVRRPKPEDERIAVFSPATSACLGCNTSMQPLGCAEQAIAALFYILPYATKNKLKAVNCLSLAVEAQLKAQTTVSRAEDAEKNELRPAMYKLTRLINSLNGFMEVSAQMCVSYLLNTPDAWTSHTTWFCHAWPAYNYICGKLEEAHLVDAAGEINDDSENDTDLTDGESHVPELIHTLGGEVDVDEDEAGHREVVLDTNNKVAVISQHTHYMYRGPELANLTFYEYCGMVVVITKAQASKIKPLDERDPRRGGRIANIMVPFDARHPEFGERFQRVRSKFVIPKLAGAPPPRMPPLPWRNTKAARMQRNKWASYMATVFIPWSADALPASHQPDDILRRFEAMKERTASDQSFVLSTWAENVSKGLRQDAVKKTLLSIYRFRKAKRWTKDDIENHEQAERLAALPPRAVAEAERLIQAVTDFQEAAHGDPDVMKKSLIARRKLEVFDNIYGALGEPSAQYASHEVRDRLPSSPEALHDVDFKAAALAIKQWERPKDAEEIHPRKNVADIEKLVKHFVASSPLRAEQKVYMERVLSDLATGKKVSNYVFHGGPGCGKSFCAREIANGVRKCLGKRTIAMAPTGVAASNVGGFTLHGLLDIPGESVHSEFPLRPFGVIKLREARKLFNNVSLVIIDEMSMLSPAFLGHVDARLRVVGEADKAFGGFKTIIMGDFFQLPPVMSSNTLYSAKGSAPQVHKNRARGNRVVNPSRVLQSMMTNHGDSLFREMHVLSFTSQQRIESSSVRQLERITKVRTSDRPYNPDFFKGIRTLSSMDADEFRFASIVLPGNMERERLNWAQTLRWGARHRQVPVRWRRDLKGTSYANLTPSQQEILYSKGPELYQAFVKGAPAYLSENVRPELGLANGTPIVLLDVVDPRFEGNPSVVPLSLPNGESFVEIPYHEDLCLVYEVPHLCRTSCECHRTLSERRTALQNQNPCFECLRDVEWEATYASVTLCKESLPTKDPTSLLPTHKRVVFSQGQARRAVTVSVEKHEISTMGIPFDMGFAITLHKVQGQTLKRVILCIDADTTYPRGINFESVYVGISRVENEDHMRLWPLRAGDTMEHVFSLSRPKELAAWCARHESGANCPPHTHSVSQPQVVGTNNTERQRRKAGTPQVPNIPDTGSVSYSGPPRAVRQRPDTAGQPSGHNVNTTPRPRMQETSRADTGKRAVPSPILNDSAPCSLPIAKFQRTISDLAPREHGLVGLKNLGNTCFANALVHCFDSCPATRRLFCTSGEVIMESGQPVEDWSSSLSCLLLRMNARYSSFVVPTQFIQYLPPEFGDRASEYDPADLLRTFWDMSRDLQESYHIRHLRITTCNVCNHASALALTVPFISIPLHRCAQHRDRVTMMSELLKRVEVPAYVDSYSCDRCISNAVSSGLSHNAATQTVRTQATTMESYTAAHSVILRLLLFSMNDNNEQASLYKRMEPVECAEIITLGGKVFVLEAVVFHLNQDFTVTRGHYVTVRKTPIGWMCVNDQLVTASGPPLWRPESTPYLLLYTAQGAHSPPLYRDPSPPPPGPPPEISEVAVPHDDHCNDESGEDYLFADEEPMEQD